MRKALYALTIAALVSIGLVAQQSGGAFIPSFAYDISGAWNFSGSPTLTSGGAIVGATATQTLTNKTLTSPTIATPTITSPTITTELMTGAGATETLTSADCGQTQLWDTAAGSVITLPAATGSGCRFYFLVTVTITSGAAAIAVVGNDEFIGGAISVGTTADQADAFPVVDAGDADTLTMNGTTTGGIAGTYCVVQDISADNWGIHCNVISTDASATPFATGQVS